MPTTFKPLERASSFRRIAAGMWRAPSDPSIHGAIDLDVTETLTFIERFRAETGKKLTVTHVVARAVAQILARHPELNVKVRFGGRLEQRQSVDVFLSVATDGGKDLSGVRVPNADERSLSDIVDLVESSVKKIRSGNDASYQRSRDAFKRVPFWLTRPVVRAIDFLTNELHVDLPDQGLPIDPFGSAVVTNVGTFGIDLAFAPLVPLGRCAMLLLLSEVRLRPLVIDGKLEVRPTLRVSGTFDHRVIDGFQAGVIARELRALVESPEPAPRRSTGTSSAQEARA